MYNRGMQSAKIGKHEIWYENPEEFRELKKEIFGQNCYYAEFENETPLIIDAGAHIGMATIYWKNLYPGAKIIAIEPLPANLELLTKNLYENQLTDVEIIEAALAPKSGEVVIHEPNGEDSWKSGAGIIPKGWRGVQASQEIKAKAIGVVDMLNQKIDLLKLDIEGMEYEVVRAAGEKIRAAKQIIIEVHPRQGNRLLDIEKNLIKYGFELETTRDESQIGKGLVVIRAVLK